MNMDQNNLEARLVRLEAQNRRLKRGGLAALVGLGSLTVMSFAAPSFCETVWAERFVLRDASNTKRITMNAYSTDTPSIAFHDARGKEIGSIGLNSDGAFKFSVMNEGKSVPASFAFNKDGSMRLAKAIVSPRGTVEKVTSKGVN